MGIVSQFLDHRVRGSTAGPSLASSETTIGDDCWIGGGVMVIGGVHIGDGCVIGAGSLVTKVSVVSITIVPS